MKKIDNLSTLTKMIMAFGLVMAISFVVNALSWSSLSFQQKSNGWTVHTYEVLDLVDNIVAAMVDRETGLRGYLLSGNENFLEPYKSGSENYRTAFDKAVALTSDNAAQQKRFAELDAYVKEWTSQVAEMEIKLMQSAATMDQARGMESAGAGKQWMDAIRAKAAEISGEEAALLTTRAAASEAAANSARMTILLGGLAMAVVIAGVLFMLQKSLISPLVRMAGSMRTLATGETSIDVPGVGRKDEVGEMAAAVEVFRQNVGLTAEGAGVVV